MTIHARKLGPGTLTLGPVGTPLEVSSQLTGCKVTPSESVASTEARKVLSGEVLAGSETATFSYVLSGNFLQDTGEVSSVVDWSWAQAGTEQDFVFVPSTAGGSSISGILYPVPLEIGGDEVDAAEMASDFTWRIKGTPVLT